MNSSVNSVLLLDSGDVVVIDVLERKYRVRSASGFVSLALVLNPAPNLELQQQFGPVGFILALLVLADDLLRSSHRERVLEVQLKRRGVVLGAQSLLLLLKYAEDQSVNDEPAVLPEEQEKPLHLAERNDLREQSRDPVDAERDNVNTPFNKVRG